MGGRSPSARIAAALVAWYDRARKPLPWRDAPTPYRVWVGEVMSQQTALSIAAARFEALVAELPDVAALAACGEDRLRRLWAGLGYYARARNLAKGAAFIADDLGGAFPENAAGWRLVPGCGPYTAAVIASVCFGERVASVDGNAVRVASRLLAMRDGVWTGAGQRAIAAALGQMAAATDRPGDLNQAVMELGQEICAKAAPRCDVCPAGSACEARRLGVVALCPPPRPRPAAVDVALTIVIPRRGADGEVAIARRTAGFLAGTIGFPIAARPQDSPRGARRLEGGFRHTITRHRLACSIAVLECGGGAGELGVLLAACGAAEPAWVSLEEAARRVESSLDRTALAAFRGAPSP